jgi:hypothetical protein
MTELQAKVERLMRQASELVGFEITADSYRRISPEQSAALLARLGMDPDFRELALTRGSPIAEANVWLSARQSGADLPLEDVGRMALGLAPRAKADDSSEDGVEAQYQQEDGAAAARSRLEALGRDPEWRAKALTRGTPEARENLELNAAASGASFSSTDLDRLAQGLGPQAGAPPDGVSP